MNQRNIGQMRNAFASLAFLAIGFAGGYALAWKNERDNFVYIFNGLMSHLIAQDIEVLTQLRTGDIDGGISGLEAGIFSRIAGWAVSGKLDEIRSFENANSPYIQDITYALEAASKYNQAHTPEQYRDDYEQVLIDAGL